VSVKTEMSYWVICDGCGYRVGEDEDYLPVYSTRAEAVALALEGDWYRVGRYQHACARCVDWDINDAPFIRKPVDLALKESDT